ncbi:hypothetical protein GALL_515490 [mine drainage metagenome]|uniref:Uncharacterized protein n=1 Tax=mine drainage metagenome TaxID=410659 RepID=A0A1J5P806_9ZZZZ
MTFPANWYAYGSSRYLEQHNASLWCQQLVNIAKGYAGLGFRRDLHF